MWHTPIRQGVRLFYKLWRAGAGVRGRGICYSVQEKREISLCLKYSCSENELPESYLSYKQKQVNDQNFRGLFLQILKGDYS